MQYTNMMVVTIYMQYIHIKLYIQTSLIPPLPHTHSYLVLPLELGPHAPEVLALALGRTDVVL